MTTNPSLTPETSRYLHLPTASHAARYASRTGTISESEQIRNERLTVRKSASPILLATSKLAIEKAQQHLPTYDSWDDMVEGVTQLHAEAVAELIDTDPKMQQKAVAVMKANKPNSRWKRATGRILSPSSNHDVKSLRQLHKEFQEIVTQGVSEGAATVAATLEVVPWLVVGESDWEHPFDIYYKQTSLVAKNSLRFLLDWAGVSKQYDRAGKKGHDKDLAAFLRQPPLGADKNPFTGLRFRNEAMHLAEIEHPRTGSIGQIVAIKPEEVALFSAQIDIDPAELVKPIYGCPAHSSVVGLYRFMHEAAEHSGLMEETLWDAMT